MRRRRSVQRVQELQQLRLLQEGRRQMRGVQEKDVSTWFNSALYLIDVYCETESLPSQRRGHYGPTKKIWVFILMEACAGALSCKRPTVAKTRNSTHTVGATAENGAHAWMLHFICDLAWIDSCNMRRPLTVNVRSTRRTCSLQLK